MVCINLPMWTTSSYYLTVLANLEMFLRLARVGKVLFISANMYYISGVVHTYDFQSLL